MCDVWQNVVVLTNDKKPVLWNTTIDSVWPIFVLENDSEINTTFTRVVDMLTTNKKCQEPGKSLDFGLDIIKVRNWII